MHCLTKLQSYHAAAMTCAGGHSQASQTKVCLPSGNAVDGAQVACEVVAVLSSMDTPHNTRDVLSSNTLLT